MHNKYAGGVLRRYQEAGLRWPSRRHPTSGSSDLSRRISTRVPSFLKTALVTMQSHS
jgi:hypothetical protein